MEIEFSNPMAPQPVLTPSNQSKDKRFVIEMSVKIILGLIVAALLAAIFITLIVRLPMNNNSSTPQVFH